MNRKRNLYRANSSITLARRHRAALKLLLAASQRCSSINRELLVDISSYASVSFHKYSPTFCQHTGRYKGSVRFFKLSRFRVKRFAELAFLPGVTRSSW